MSGNDCPTDNRYGLPSWTWLTSADMMINLSSSSLTRQNMVQSWQKNNVISQFFFSPFLLYIYTYIYSQKTTHNLLITAWYGMYFGGSMTYFCFGYVVCSRSNFFITSVFRPEIKDLEPLEPQLSGKKRAFLKINPIKRRQLHGPRSLPDMKLGGSSWKINKELIIQRLLGPEHYNMIYYTYDVTMISVAYWDQILNSQGMLCILPLWVIR